MGTIKYPSEINIDGPWILNAESLEELHEIVESSWTLLVDEFETYKETTIRSQLDKDKKEDNEKNRKEVLERLALWHSYKFKQEEKSFIGLLHGDKKIISKSLKDLIYDPQIDDQKINGLIIELTKWENTLQIEIDNRYGGAFKVKYRGSNDELKRSLFTSFNKWTKKHSPKTHVRLWNKISPEHWFIFFLLTVVQLLIFPNNSDYWASLKTHAKSTIIG